MTSPTSAPVSLAVACSPDSFWDRWCRNASPEQKQHILPAAITSGLVQIHLLPVPGLQASRNSLQNLIASVVANRPPTLEPVVLDGVQFIDEDLDEDQRHAVSVAISSPDLSLILGQPGSGKSRVVGEILRQALRRSQRVLFVAPMASALDRVIDLAQDLAPRILLCAGADESAPPRNVGLTLQARLRHFDQQTLPTARVRVEESKQQLAQHASLEDTWPRLRALPGQLEALTTRRTALEQQRQALATVVESEWASTEVSIPEWAELRRRHLEAENAIDLRLRQLADEVQTLQEETTRLGNEHTSLTLQAEASGHSRWWNLAFWTSRGLTDPVPRLAELDRVLETQRTELSTLEQERDTLRATRQRAEAEYLARSADLCRAEVERREVDLVRELEENARATVAATAEWTAVLPADIRPTVVEAAEQTWRTDHTSLSQELARREAWLMALEQTRPGLAFDLIVGARILAVPISEVLTLGMDRSPGAFDLLVLDDGHRVSEKDLLALARLAPRCVLVGESGVSIPVPHGPKRVVPARPTDSASNVLQRLWSVLHPDPLRVSATWILEGDRLIARLQPSCSEDEAQISREPVFDRPEIELAISTPPGAAPHLVEVVFPAAMRLEDAKAFLLRETGEVAIQAPGPGFRWRESAEGFHLHFGSVSAISEARISLDKHVVEHLGRCEWSHSDEPAWYTLGLSFARADGWERNSAANWIAERLGLRDVGRTACLARVYRARTVLASFLSELLFPRQPASVQAPPACTAVEFVAVPCGDHKVCDTPIRTLGSPEAAAHVNGAATLAPCLGRHRGGAGFEVDLGDARRLDALSVALRTGLPPRGIVNLHEARAVVQTLESLVQHPSALTSRGAADPQIAVLSVHLAQAELLRLLVRQSTALADSGLRILVGQPSVLAHRECPLVCLSLTRSHATRAVPFSDDPRDLILALTRATERLLVFGDPGTMVRRGQWFGALDHLTETTGPIEQAILTRILSQFSEGPSPARPGKTLENSGV